MSVKIVVGNIRSKIVGILSDEVHAHLDQVLRYKVQNAKYMPSVKAKKWDGVVHLYEKYREQCFFTGLLSLVRETLRKEKIEFEIVDRRVRPDQNYPELKFIPPSDYEDRDYQKFTIDRSIKFTRGILSLATGAGKTLIVTRIISEIKTYPFVFYVLTKDLMEQAHGVLSSCLNVPIGKIGDGEVDIRKITVCTIQTAIRALNHNNRSFTIDDYKFDDEDEWGEKDIKDEEKIQKIKKLIGVANGVYMDECHHASAKTVREVLSASINAYWRYGGSATPIREDGASIVIQAMFGTKIVDVNASYLIKKGDLVKPYIFIEPISDKINLHSYQKIYEHCVVKNESFNKHVAQTVNHLVQRGLSILVLVQQYKQGDYLKTLIPNSEFITGKLSSSKRLEYIEKLRRGEITLIATSLADEGLDARGLDAVIMAGGGKSCTKVNQRLGRALRKDKKSAKSKDRAIAIVYKHDAKYLDRHAEKTRSILKREPEFVIMDSKGPNYICGEIDKILGAKNTQLGLFD